ncbi:25S rRNA (adenine(2142)-N(1))-methyltransferase, Bmt2 [Ceraceosorus bombacis]|uniref:25S rRNA (Adenine(2142)-N(1))-methyltransferase, Bmt2 n=1 Tax=Ceraceosorus bombacis TaxID=401625 RepID=A0A0P1BL14_9BASI|nr:25S rRNA (adenine(2142)-N(1))-methyltransferase, Bmt2 [Ceraceosorus bombacis]
MSHDMVVKDGNGNGSVQIGTSSSADADAAGAAIRPRTRGKRGGAKNKKSAAVEDVVAAAAAAPHQHTSEVAGTSSTSAPLSTEAARAAPVPVGQATTESVGAVVAKSGKPKAAVRRDEDGKLIRPRGKRGGSKNNNKKDVSSSSGKDSNRNSAISSAFKKSIKSKSNASSSSSSSLHQNSTLPSAAASAHSLAIAQWHALEKELSQPNTSPARKQEILKRQKELGGLRAYQDASVVGANHLKAGETGKWCAEMLQEVRGKEPLHLLDVGAIAGTAYLKYPWINSTSIDLEPRSEAVIKSDFFDFAKPDLDRQQAEDVWSKAAAAVEGRGEGQDVRVKRWRGKFDVVALSLVVNYVGDLEQRGRMLLHAHHYLTPTGYLYLVLPNACGGEAGR